MFARGLQVIRQSSRAFTIDLKSLPEHRSLVIDKYGGPEDVKLLVRKPEEVLPTELGPQHVLVEHLVACINPADVNITQGVYGRLPKELPAVIGNEGVVRVKGVGSEVTGLKPGDLALGVLLLGYWQSYSVQHVSDLFRIDNDLDVDIAAQLKVNPCTAYRMLKDFHHLKPGDAIIQNGANSAVGVNAIQLAKLWGIKTINVVRDKPDKEKLIKELKDYGADYVLSEAEISNREITTPILKEIGKPKLLLDCVGGKNASNCLRLLGDKGYVITYGMMSKQPLVMSASSLIFKDIRHVGFWVSRWYEDRVATKRDEISAMLDDVSDMFKKGLLRSKSTKSISFEDRNLAFSGSNNTKFLFSINKR